MSVHPSFRLRHCHFWASPLSGALHGLARRILQDHSADHAGLSGGFRSLSGGFHRFYSADFTGLSGRFHRFYPADFKLIKLSRRIFPIPSADLFCGFIRRILQIHSADLFGGFRGFNRRISLIHPADFLDGFGTSRSSRIFLGAFFIVHRFTHRSVCSVRSLFLLFCSRIVPIVPITQCSDHSMFLLFCQRAVIFVLIVI